MSNQFSPLFPDPWQGLDIQINAGYIISGTNRYAVVPNNAGSIKSLKDIDPRGITDAMARVAQGSIIDFAMDDGEPTQPLVTSEYKPALEWLTADCTACRCAPLSIYRSDLGTYRIVTDNWSNGDQLYCATDIADLRKWFDALFQSTNSAMYDLNAPIWEKENYY